jgi:hypothetical protein
LSNLGVCARCVVELLRLVVLLVRCFCPCQFFKAKGEAAAAARDVMLAKMTPGQRAQFLKDEEENKARDALKSKHVIKTTALFKNPKAAATAKAGAQGGRGGGGKGKATAAKGKAVAEPIPAGFAVDFSAAADNAADADDAAP